MLRDKFKSALNQVMMALIVVFAASFAMAQTCKDVLSHASVGHSLSEVYDSVYDFTNLREGIKLLQSSVPRSARDPFVELPIELIDPYDGEIPVGFGMNFKSGHLSINRLAPYINWGPFSGPEYTKAFRTGEDLEDLFISVHSQQSSIADYALSPFSTFWHISRSRFTDRIVDELLSTSEFQNIPRLFLVSEEFKVRSAKFLNQASLLYYSQHGEIAGALPYARNYHVVGEQFRACVKSTVHKLIHVALSEVLEGRSNIFLYSDFLLNTNGNNIDINSVTKLFPLRDSIVDRGVEALLFDILPHWIIASADNGHVIIEYDAYSNSVEILNTKTKSVVKIHII